MKMNEMLKKKWYKVRLNNNNKTFAVTKQEFSTKASGMETVKSNSYDVLKFSHLSKMMLEGWVEFGTQPSEEIEAVEIMAAQTKVIKNVVKKPQVEFKTVVEQQPQLNKKITLVANRSYWERLQEFIYQFKRGKYNITDCSKYNLELSDVLKEAKLYHSN